MKKAVLALTIILTLSMTVHAQKDEAPQWEEIKIDDAGNTFYYEKNTVEHKGDKVYLWTMVKLGATTKHMFKEQTGKDASTNKMNMVIDCPKKAASHLLYVTFDDSNNIVEAYKSEKEDEMIWKDIESGNPLDLIHKKFCSQ